MASTAYRDVVFNTKLGGVGSAATSAKSMSTTFKSANTSLKAMSKNAGAFASRMRGAANGLLSIKGIILGGAAMRVVGFFRSLVEAMDEQEKAETRLATAMRASGNFRRDAMEGLKEYAAALQETTTYSDEQILAAQGMLATFKMTPAQIKEVTKAMLDMSAGTGASLESTAILLGKAFTGQLGALSRYGVMVDKNAFKVEGFSAVIKELNSEFGGMAEAMAQTPVGKLKQLGNVWGDIKEEMGLAIVESGAFDALMVTIKEGMADLKSFLDGNPDFLGDVFSTGVTALKGFLSAIPGILEGLSFMIDHSKTLLTIWLGIKGAMAGAQVGSIFGPIGKLIGGLLGAGVGAYAGNRIGAALEGDREALERQRYEAAYLKVGSGATANINNENTININVEGPDISDAVYSVTEIVKEEAVKPLDDLGDEYYQLAEELRTRDRYTRTV